jgi:hypothetical protein
MFAPVADQADDVLRDEPSDGAAGIHADNRPPARVRHEAGGLEVHRVIVEAGTRAAAMARIGTVADGKPQPVPDDQVLGGGFPVFQMSMATWMLLSGRPLLVSKTPGTHG